MGIDSTPGPGVVFLTHVLLAELNPDKTELVASLLALSEEPADDSSAKANLTEGFDRDSDVGVRDRGGFWAEVV